MNAENGLIHLESKHSVDETLQRLQLLLQEKNINIFALVDHSGEAAKVGLAMRPTKLLIFGSPKGGTPLMEAAPTVAIDLRLRTTIPHICSKGIMCRWSWCRTLPGSRDCWRWRFGRRPTLHTLNNLHVSHDYSCFA
jgi:hypothetical protein